MEAKKEFIYRYRLLSRTRALNKILIMFRQYVFGAELTGLGQEAVSVGPCLALLKKGVLLDSPLSGDHRTVEGIAVMKDEVSGANCKNVLDLLRNHFGKALAWNRGQDGNIHWGCLKCRTIPFACSDMGRMPGVMVGFIQELARRQPEEIDRRPVGVAFFGEGAFQQGGLYEAMNWVAASNHPKNRDLRGAPAFFIVNNNGRSLYTDHIDEHGESDLAKRANGFGNMVGVDADGDDLEEMIKKTSEAIDRARNFQSTLIVAHTYRRTGHNEDQIKRNMERVKAGDVEHGEILDIDPEEFKKEWEREPLKRYREKLIANGSVEEKALLAIDQEEFEAMRSLAEEVLHEPAVDLEEHRKDRSYFPTHVWTLPEKPKNPSDGKVMRYNDALLWILEKLMAEDDSVIYFGEDVATGGVLIKTRDLAKKFGNGRVFNTPLAEEAMIANAAGRALAGGHPFCEFQFAPFFGDAFPIFASVIAPNWYQKKMRFGLVAIAHSGIVHGGGSGHFHESWIEGYFLSMGGIAVVAPANAYDFVGLVRAAYEFPGPVVILPQIKAYGNSEFASFIPEEEFLIPFGKADVKRAGKDITVITYGAASVSAAINEANYLEEEKISVEVLDLRSLWPLDLEAIEKSIAKTQRFIITHEADKFVGAGSHVLREMFNKGLMVYARNTGKNCVLAPEAPVPSVKNLVWDRLPYEEEEMRAKDQKGRDITRKMLRSKKLADIIRKQMDY